MKKTTLHIQGMHCPSCDILVADKFKEVKGVKEVKANFRSQKAEVCYSGRLDKNELNQKIQPFGYQIVDHAEEVMVQDPLSKRLTDAGAIAIVLFILYFFAQEFNLIPQFNGAVNLSLLTVFILGLIASTSTCMATSGALFMATVGKLNQDSSTTDSQNNLGSSSLMSALTFNVGRILSYGFFGFVVGLVGKTLVANFQLGSFLTLFVSVIMILIGLDMAKLLPFSAVIGSSITKGIFKRLEGRLIKNPQKTSFFLGAITYLLPCGFTQAVQVYALGTADPFKSSLIMMIFALGTVPALMAMGYASSFTKSSLYPQFMKAVGVAVIMISLLNVSNFLAIYGVAPSFFTQRAQVKGENVQVTDGYQIATMSVSNRGYSPNSFTITKNTPVRWVINGDNVFGCQGYLVAPKLGLQKALAKGKNVVEFTPQEAGPIYFSCAMGMYRGVFNVVERS